MGMSVLCSPTNTRVKYRSHVEVDVGLALAFATSLLWAMPAVADEIDDEWRSNDDSRTPHGAASHSASAPAPGPAPTLAALAQAAPQGMDVPFGFYRDQQGRLMQVSFDLQERIWLGVAYAPRRRSSGTVEIAPAAFEFGAAYEVTTPDGKTRHRFHILDGEARLHPFGFDVTGFRYDLSHHHDTPILRVTTFFGEPARHDLYLNVGLYTEALHFDVAPRGLPGEYTLTLATFQGTVDLWQSADLRSYLRLRAGPALEMRLGSWGWGDDTRFVGFLPQTVLEGNMILGKRALQQLSFRLRGEFVRSLTVQPRSLPWDWLVAVEGAWEAILIAINDQPVSLRLAGQAGLRNDAGVAMTPGAITAGTASGWEWKTTAALRVSFFSPPVPRRHGSE